MGEYKRPDHGNKTPSAVYRAGKIVGRVWPNYDKDGKIWYSVTLMREFIDADGKPGTAGTFGINDLLPAAEVLRLCWAWINNLD